MSKRRVTRGKKPATPQTPRESKVPGNKRVKAPSGRTTWLIKVPR